MLFWFSFLLLSFVSGQAQQPLWPALVQASGGSSVKVYEPQPESYANGIMKMRAAISVTGSSQQDPVFGVIWADVQMENASGDGLLYWKNVSITNIKLPGDISDDELSQLKSSLENSLPRKGLSLSQSDLNAKLGTTRKETELSSNLSIHPPKIIYTKKPSILVTIDGQPQLQQNPDWNVQQVVNTPFVIFRNDDQYYLYGNKKWYRSGDVTGPWTNINSLPSSLSKINEEVRANDTSSSNHLDYTVPDVVVSLEPAELIQSNGEANFSPVEGTGLLYMTNSANDIFLDVTSQQYYVLISGRWYRSVNLTGNWNFVPATSLPKDFAQIPEGSPKDAVLANVAGTQAARDAVADAQLPQTAKVDRSTATANITYDGAPQFESISGTRLKYAVNTPGTVLNIGRDYYAVENGVWFESGSANGPWTVATVRPEEVENIPPTYPVYNSKYVYIYDVTPDYVWMGYTPGYLGNYVYGPTIFYGTGYYYRPWRGHYYYPRPVTWGYSMRYNPWYGWGFGVDVNFGWLNIGFGNRYHSSFWGSRGGWFGPSVYHPSYYQPYSAYYGPRVQVYGGNYYRTNNNIYSNRRGLVSYGRPAYAYNRTLSRPTNPSGGRYYNPNGYNNTNRTYPGGDPNSGRRNDPPNSNGGMPNRTTRGRFPGQSPNNGMNNRPDPNRTPGNRMPDNGTSGNRMPDYRTPDNRTPGNRFPGNNAGNPNNGPGDRSPRVYQPQNQPNNNRNPTLPDRPGFERPQGNNNIDRGGFPGQTPRGERGPQVQQPQPGSSDSRPRMEAPRQTMERGNGGPRFNSGSGSGNGRSNNSGGGNGGGRSVERPERGSSGRRGG